MTKMEQNLRRQLAEARAQIADQEIRYNSLKKSYDRALEELKLALKNRFGRKSEKLDSDHNQLVFEAFQQDVEASEQSDKEAAAREEVIEESRKQQKQKRKPRVAEDAQVQEEVITLEAEEQVCPQCHCPKQVIRKQETVEYDFIPARFIKRIYVRPVCACPKCQGYVSQAALPERPIDKSDAGAGLLSQIIVGKYNDHLPLYRQEQIFARHGLNLSRSTMNNWLEHCARWGQPVGRAQLEKILQSGYIQVDETPVKVIDPQRPGKSRQSYLWVIHNPHCGVYFHFAEGRGAREIIPLLKGFKGVMQTDGYSAYESLMANPDVFSQGDVLHVGCWAHARRKFFEARELGQSQKAGEIIARIQKLYRIEKQSTLEGNDNDQRSAIRQQKSKPVLEDIIEMIRQYLHDPSITPSSRLGQACSYVQERWKPLVAYLNRGQVLIDNNPVENKIRPAALGRKNWLFIGHPKAGWRTGVFYTLMANCRMQKVNPFDYWKTLLEQIPSAKQSEIERFLPGNLILSKND